MRASRRASPANEAELLARARALAGLSLGRLAADLGRPIPADLRRAKGWAGELLERALGAPGMSRPEPDFAALGVELKTLPVGADGRPRESTHVCSVPLAGAEGLTWERSLVRRKLARVLWVPVEAAPDVAPSRRRIGTALLWSPSPAEESCLRADWEELMELVALGAYDRLRGHLGTCLQVRPKAASGRARTAARDASGAPAMTLPRGFYLRASFTARILEQHYARGVGGGW